MIDRFQAMPRVDQHKSPRPRHASGQIVPDKPLPLFDFFLRRFRKAITGKIDQIARRPEIEIVDLLRASRRIRGPRQSFAPRQRVDQAGLPDIRAPGEADLGPIRRRQSSQRNNAFHEVTRPCKQLAPDFNRFRFNRGVDEEGNLNHRSHKLGTVRAHGPGPPAGSPRSA